MLGLDTVTFILFIFCIGTACAFEFVNGFHDTANAVATVIYTRALNPRYAVTWSGFCNFLGVLVGGVSVAMGIVNLLPLSDLAATGLQESVSFALGLLLSAIFWNLGTWYLGIPCSSSHTLIGSIIGAGIMFHWLHPVGDGVNWSKAIEIGSSLLISPLFGFTGAIILMYIGRQSIHESKEIFKEPPPDERPPMWIRVILFSTCTGVSFFHGSNDGQKGVGLVMIILMTFFPITYALNTTYSTQETKSVLASIEQISVSESRFDLRDEIDALKTSLGTIGTPGNDNATTRFQVRKSISKLNKAISEEVKIGEHFHSQEARAKLKELGGVLKKDVEFAPLWVLIMISVSLGIGTTVGWRRIVVTIGEKIGKRHMTYAEGAAAEIVAAATIGLSSGFGLPVSTTHVLSSGVAGAMTASKGVKNLQPKTIQNMMIAWVLTLPVCIILSGCLYWLLRHII